MAFVPGNTDFNLSPYTGLTRQSWLEAAKYLLENVFSRIGGFDSPVVVPRTEKDITYPRLNSPADILERENRAERFEGLARTLFIAAPLIRNEPQVVLAGIPLREYYKSHILASCTRGSAEYVGAYDDLQELAGDSCRDGCFQQTVETAALVIGLWACKEQIWDCYTREEKDRIAAFLQSYARARTYPQNWRLFNMLDMAFLSMEGYEIDGEIMFDHAQSILHYYAGDGWYRDGHAFDYYSCWAFQFYAPLWNLWYGYEHMPQIAAAFEEHSAALMKTYPQFFDEQGHTNMWGRSSIYRFAAVSAFNGNLFLPRPSVDCGLARRIASGSLMQFLGRDDFLSDGIPTLGFYGQFLPLVQAYSCAESVFWMGKAFLFLNLPAEHPFWTERENNGVWERLAPRSIHTTVLNGPALAYTNHKANGSTVLRTGKVAKNRSDIHGMWCYGKLAYSTQYPWESSPSDDVEAMQYVLTQDGAHQRANAILWSGMKDGVLYRRQFFDCDLCGASSWTQAVDLADFAVPYGIFRADRLCLVRRPVALALGSYGFPDNGTTIVRRESKNAKAIILKGYDSRGGKKQMAMTVWGDWQLEVQESRGTNPDSGRSLIVVARASRTKEYGYEPYLLLSQVITREDHEDFSPADLFPLSAVKAEDERNFSAFGKTVLKLAEGEVTLDFDCMEGNLQF